MRFTFFRRCAFAAYLLFSSATGALAIGPSNQVISPTYDRVVRVLKDVGLGGGVGFMEGTGSVVGNQNVNGNGYLWVLTADHVVSSNGTRTGATAAGLGLAFGNSPTNSGNSTYFASATADASHVFRGGTTGFKDMALVGINYGAYDSAKSSLVVNLVSNGAFIDFSDIGYGNQGNLVAGGYQAQNSYGTERYFTERITWSNANWADPQGYIYPAWGFQILGPGDSEAVGGGGGAALDADSGSPWFSTGFNGSYFTTGQFAILTGINSAPVNGLFPFTATERALALSNADINWINSIVGVPEPGTFAVIILAIVPVACRPGRRD